MMDIFTLHVNLKSSKKKNNSVCDQYHEKELFPYKRKPQKEIISTSNVP